MKIVLLMAGEGRRFLGQEAEPKPLIKLSGRELIKWAVNSYNIIGLYLDWSDLYFITRLDHVRDFAIDKLLKSYFSPRINIRCVEKTTRGPAETALLVEKDIPGEEQVIVSDCDMFFNCLPLFNEMLAIKNDEAIRGVLPYIRRQDKQNSWSYVRIGQAGFAEKVAEKDAEMFVAGCPGIVGAYSFNRWEYFTQEAKQMIQEGDLAGQEGKKEYYMSKIFQRFLAAGHKVKTVEVTPAWILGTPEQFKAFEKFIETGNIS